MTTQENIAKHLGVEINEPFTTKLLAKPLHVDPNLGVVTADGDRLSNVLLQELLFGNVEVVKQAKKHFVFAPKNYNISSTIITNDILQLFHALENPLSGQEFLDMTIEQGSAIAEKHVKDIKYIYQFEAYIDDCFGIYGRMDGVQSLSDVYRVGIECAVEHIMYDNFSAIIYNLLARFLADVGVSTIRTKEEIEQIMNTYSHNIDSSSTANDVVEEFLKEL